MASPTQCPEPDGCSWERRTLDGIELFVCSRCGQVRMDQSALQKLTAPHQVGPEVGPEVEPESAPEAPPAEPRPVPHAPRTRRVDPGGVTDPVGSPASRIPIPAPMGGGYSGPLTPPPMSRARTPAITPGVPPKRTPTPRPRASRDDASQYTVVPFAGPGDSGDYTALDFGRTDYTDEPAPEAGAPPRRTPPPAPQYTGPTPRSTPTGRAASPPPPPPPNVRSVAPRHDEDDAVEELRAAPLPLARQLEEETKLTWAPDADDMPTTVDADSARRNAIDDSRIPTEERPMPEPVRGPSGPRHWRESASDPDSDMDLGLRAAITRGDEPGLGLSAAVTQYEEPDLGLPAEVPPVDDDFLAAEEGDSERFFTDETTGYDAGWTGPAAEAVDADVEWKSRRSALPRIALVVVVVLLIVGALSVAAVAILPDLRAQLGMGRAAPDDGPSLATLDEDPEIAEPDADGADDTPEGTAAAGTTDDVAAPDLAGAPDDAGKTDDDGAPDGTAEPGATTAPATTAPEPETTAPEPETTAPEPEKAAPVATAASGSDGPAPGQSYQALIDQGWNTVDGDPEAAADLFRAALDMKMGDTEASYGLGYAMLQLGQRVGAKAYLCAAAGSADEKDRTEILGVVESHGLACE